MLGAFRFVLAMMVVTAHLSDLQPVRHYGMFAVFGFYVLSGFLMTQVLNRVYRFDFRRYSINRLLRIFPAYYLIALMTIAVIAWQPQAAAGFHPAWTFQGADVTGNVILLPFANYDGNSFRLVPPTWSVAVELVLYFMLWAVMSRGPRTAIACVATGAAYHVASYAVPMDRYYLPSAAFLPFALGAMIYFAKERFPLNRSQAVRVAAVASFAWAANVVIAGDQQVAPWGIPGSWAAPFYLNLALMSVAVFALAHLAQGRLDKLAGEFAYPVFLLHWLAGFIVYQAFATSHRGLDLLLTSIPLLLVMSLGVILGTRKLVDPARDRIRPGSNDRLQAAQSSP